MELAAEAEEAKNNVRNAGAQAVKPLIKNFGGG